MAWQGNGKSATVGPQGTGLEQGFAEAAARGVGIQPNAHPELDQSPRGPNFIQQMMGSWGHGPQNSQNDISARIAEQHAKAMTARRLFRPDLMGK